MHKVSARDMSSPLNCSCHCCDYKACDNCCTKLATPLLDEVRHEGGNSGSNGPCDGPCAVQVYKGRRRGTGQITAMKFIMKHGKSEKDIKNLRQEVEILRQLRHENIIQMLDAFETKTDFCVVTGRTVQWLHWLFVCLLLLTSSASVERTCALHLRVAVATTCMCCTCTCYSQMGHHNICNLVSLAVVMAELGQGELFEILEDDQCLPEDVVRSIAKQLVRALHYLHSNRIIHR